MLKRGTPFACRTCGTPIVLPKASVGLAALVFAALSLLSGRVPGVLILLIIVAALLFEWLLSPVEVADPQARVDSATPSSAEG